MHDPAAVIACTHPELFTINPMPLTVLTEGDASGQTVTGDGIKTDDVGVCIDVLAEKVRDLWIERVKTLA